MTSNSLAEGDWELVVYAMLETLGDDPLGAVRELVRILLGACDETVGELVEGGPTPAFFRAGRAGGTRNA